jgi:hypothetical protein
MVNDTAEEWRRQIHVHLRQAGVPVSLQDLGQVVKRPAGMALTRKLGKVLGDDQRFVLDGSGPRTTVRSSDDGGTGFLANMGSITARSSDGEKLFEKQLNYAQRVSQTAAAFWETLCGDTALRLRCRDRAVLEEEYRAWKRQMDAQGVRVIGSPGGLLKNLRMLGHLRPSVHIDVLIFACDGMGADEVVREVLSNRESTENDRGGIVILPREVPSSPPPTSASLGLTDYSQVDVLGLRYTPVNFGARTSPGASSW